MEKKPRTIRFYEKNGFIGLDKHRFRLADEEQQDITIKLQIK